MDCVPACGMNNSFPSILSLHLSSLHTRVKRTEFTMKDLFSFVVFRVSARRRFKNVNTVLFSDIVVLLIENRSLREAHLPNLPDSWCLGPLDTWCLGLLVPWTLGHMDSWSLGHLDTWTLGPLDTWTHGLLVPWTLGHMDSWSLGVLGSSSQWTKCCIIRTTEKHRYLKDRLNHKIPLPVPCSLRANSIGERQRCRELNEHRKSESTGPVLDAFSIFFDSDSCQNATKLSLIIK